MPTCGIYKITNQINGKCYIGQSVNIERRWQEHKRFNSREQLAIIHQAFRKYGLENFSFEILEECSQEQLDDLSYPLRKHKAQFILCPLSREKLKQLVRKRMFTSIAQEFSVSPETVSRWCRRYNLPYRKKEIDSIPNEIWEQV